MTERTERPARALRRMLAAPGLERQIKPWQMGRKAWLFAGSEMAGQRAAVVMSLVQSAKINGHDPWQYLRDVLARLPTHLNSRLHELLPHRWQPNAACKRTPA